MQCIIYQHLQRGAKWFLKGVNLSSLRVQLAPLWRSRYIYFFLFVFSMYVTPPPLPFPSLPIVHHHSSLPKVSMFDASAARKVDTLNLGHNKNWALQPITFAWQIFGCVPSTRTAPFNLVGYVNPYFHLPFMYPVASLGHTHRLGFAVPTQHIDTLM